MKVDRDLPFSFQPVKSACKNESKVRTVFDEFLC
jgi:hypothetical protein